MAVDETLNRSNPPAAHYRALRVDPYHAVHVAPLSLPAEGPTGAFVVGYESLQLGGGNAFLRLLAGSTLRARPRSVA